MATSLMSIGLLGMSAGAIELTRAAKISDMTAAATALATAQLEVIRSLPLTSAQQQTGTYSAGTKYANGVDGGPYTVGWVVSANNTPSWGLKTVTVTTSWNQNGTTRSVAIASAVRCTKTPC